MNKLPRVFGTFQTMSRTSVPTGQTMQPGPLKRQIKWRLVEKPTTWGKYDNGP